MFDPLESAKLISRKIREEGKFLNFHTVEWPQSKFPIRLLRSVQFFNFLFTILLKKYFTFLGSEQDYIKIAGVTVPFLVKGSKVYFDLLAAFALMGQLQLAMKNDWKEIDAMLHEQGFDLRVAFRINISGKN